MDSEISDLSQDTGARRKRQCLICQVQFISEWSGERVCLHCKAGSAWRQGSQWPPGNPPA